MDLPAQAVWCVLEGVEIDDFMKSEKFFDFCEQKKGKSAVVFINNCERGHVGYLPNSASQWKEFRLKITL